MNLSIIPESAPFNAEQRAWLNGFLAGWLGLQAAGDATPAAGPSATGPAPVADEEPPWHDPALPLDERLKRAEGRPLPDQLMAAMAQLNCGACGYVCRTYSEAIAVGSESSLSLCSPGGSETSKALKRILKFGKPAANGSAKHGHAEPAPSGWSRKNPYPAAVLRSVRLNGPGSEKETRHVEIDLGDSGLTYKVGDALGIYPTNCDDLVDAVLAALGARGDEPVDAPGETVREALARHRCLAEVNEDCLALLADSATNPADSAQIRAWMDGDGPPAGTDVLDVLRQFPSARPAPADFVRALSTLRPRLYSISSSPRKHARQVHLTVARVSSVVGGRNRKGVASTMLADRVNPGTRVRVFIQESHGFTVPADPTAPMIMIGPGTGIAPFRAFLHERDILGATGKNWLFFGDQRAAFDFLYEDELTDLAARGVLTRLETAFSRDGDRKVYVQHRLLDCAREVFDWLQDGASVFVCGDAKRMAVDVDRALREIVRNQGRMDDDSAAAYLASLSSSGRYLRDVY